MSETIMVRVAEYANTVGRYGPDSEEARRVRKAYIHDDEFLEYVAALDRVKEHIGGSGMDEPATPVFGQIDGTERLCLATYGRGARARDYIGGSEARMLHDAATEIHRLRAAVGEREAWLDKIKETLRPWWTDERSNWDGSLCGLPVEVAGVATVIRELEATTNRLLEACKRAYRHVALADEDIGSCELGNDLADDLAEVMGDEAFQAWVKEVSPWDDEDD